MASTGDADVVLVHAPDVEKKYVDTGDLIEALVPLGYLKRQGDRYANTSLTINPPGLVITTSLAATRG